MAIDTKEELVTVRGTMDVTTLPDYVKDRLKRSVLVIPTKKDDGGGNKKEKGEKGGDKKKGGGSGGGDGGAEKKGKQDGDGGGEREKNKGAGGAKVVPEASRMEYNMYGGGLGGYPPYSYHHDVVHAPQLFSDENPNACTIM